MNCFTTSKSSFERAVERAESKITECRREWDECDEDFEDDDDREPDLDPGFSSWDDYYNYKY